MDDAAIEAKTNARLHELLDAQTKEIKALRAKLAVFEQREEERSLLWCRHTKPAEDLRLPVPRLELRWSIDAHGAAIAVYALIYRHFLDHLVSVPLGRTECTGSCASEKLIAFDGTVDLPFRDGAHIKHDMMRLGLPAYAIFNEHITPLDVLSKSMLKTPPQLKTT